MQHILCFGEILLRMSPEPGWPAKPAIQTFVGGAEINVAIALGTWGVPVSAGTALPESFVAAQMISYLQDHGIDSRKVLRQPGRIGTYYLNQGADLKSAGVVYDRSGSSFADMEPDSVDWDKYLEGITHLHLTAISPAVSKSAAACCMQLLQAAAKKDICISLDLNYRDKLWKYGADPGIVMPAIARYAHIIMGNIWAANRMLHTPLDEQAATTTDPAALTQMAEATSRQIMAGFPNCKIVANTFRFNEKDGQVLYFGTLYSEGKIYASRQQRYANTVDKAGSGDCFMAGLLYGILHKKDAQQIVDFATATATGKFYEMGDHTRQSIDQIEKKVAENNQSVTINK